MEYTGYRLWGGGITLTTKEPVGVSMLRKKKSAEEVGQISSYRRGVAGGCQSTDPGS